MSRIVLKPALWLAALLCAALFSAVGIAHASDKAELEKLQKEVLGVTVQLNGNCSGTVIYSNRDKVSGEVTTLILSAGHCAIDKDADQRIEFPVYQDNEVIKKDAYVGKVFGVYYNADLSLWKLKDKQTFFSNVAKLAPEKPTLLMGEDVWTVGYPLGLGLTVTKKGLFASKETSDFAKAGTVYYKATPDIAPGSSGGALYHKNDAGDYELLGVTTAGMRGFPYYGLYTPVSDIYAYLKVAAPDIVIPPKP
jgi:V8-like Glu-specific endopeptidase